MYFFSSLGSLLEVATIAVFLNFLLSFFWYTRSMDLFLGLIAFLAAVFASSWFSLPVLQKIIYIVLNVAIVAIVVLFQPELRVALSKFGIRGTRRKETNEFELILEQITSSVYRLSEKQHGALIVIEHTESISDFAKSGIMLNAAFSSELLETIFSSSTPLHDGAILLKNNTILAAGCILPLADDSNQISRSMGTRHRAALGASLNCDGLIVVISEESGKVSIAREGVMTRGLQPDRFRAILRTIFNPSGEVKQNYFSFNLLEWLRR